eukprot:c13520_g1_i1.p1 GENE.c13520_g1_i1~~c13520_g1_i1.p1  ORF type:complete len:434 (+),score=94.00 c13520_g1_i1:24-1304(+)
MTKRAKQNPDEVNLDRRSLESLDLANVHVKATRISARFNSIRQACDLSSLRNLSELDLRCNNITDLSFVNFCPESLASLLLDRNAITTLPAGISRLTNLTKLALSNNAISSIPPNTLPRSLTELDLHCNQLTQVPPDIEFLTGLKIFSLSVNKIRTLPAFLGRLGKLEQLAISTNRLTDMSPLLSLPAITHLTLSRNRITEIPQGISALTTLINLQISENLISALPASITFLPVLSRIDLRLNPVLLPARTIKHLLEKSRKPPSIPRTHHQQSLRPGSLAELACFRLISWEMGLSQAESSPTIPHPHTTFPLALAKVAAQLQDVLPFVAQTAAASIIICDVCCALARSCVVRFKPDAVFRPARILFLGDFDASQGSSQRAAINYDQQRQTSISFTIKVCSNECLQVLEDKIQRCFQNIVLDKDKIN